jgi:hypothetical protein
MDKPGDDWQMENHPYSPAGEVEGMGRFADGVNRRRRRGQRTVIATVVVLALIVPAVLGVVTVLLDAFG